MNARISLVVFALAGTAVVTAACDGANAEAKNGTLGGASTDSAAQASAAAAEINSLTLTRTVANQLIAKETFWTSDDVLFVADVEMGRTSLPCAEAVAQAVGNRVAVARDAGLLTLTAEPDGGCRIAPTPKATALPEKLDTEVGAAFMPKAGRFGDDNLRLLGQYARFGGVTGISQSPNSTQAEVEFAIQWVNGPYVGALSRPNSITTPLTRSIAFRKYDDGWRIALAPE